MVYKVDPLHFVCCYGDFGGGIRDINPTRACTSLSEKVVWLNIVFGSSSEIMKFCKFQNPNKTQCMPCFLSRNVWSGYPQHHTTARWGEGAKDSRSRHFSKNKRTKRGALCHKKQVQNCQSLRKPVFFLLFCCQVGHLWRFPLTKMCSWSMSLWFIIVYSSSRKVYVDV